MAGQLRLDPECVLLMVFTLLLFPDGRPPSSRWRSVGFLAAGACTVIVVTRAIVGWPLRGPRLISADVFAGAGPVARATLYAAFAVFLLAQVAAAVSMLVRFRRSRGVEREQIKWFAPPAVLLLAAAGTAAAGAPVGEWVYALALAAVPVATCVAILRYRLYEIDRLVSRTLTYGLVTAVLGAVYVACVVVVREILPTGSSELAVAGSTLTVAALFRPLRRRVQALVDRRFNRARYSAEQVAEAFRVRLRDEVDLDHLTSDLITVVAATVEPQRVSLWLRN